MRKSSVLAFLLVAVGGVAQIGCRACSNCYDYAPPVMGAECGGCQGCRSGSCLSGEPGAAHVAEAPGQADETYIR